MDEPILQFFAYDHLPEPLRDVSRSFCELAKHVAETLPRNAERSVALRKILEGKDAAVRAALSAPSTRDRPTPTVDSPGPRETIGG